ncbi:MAG: molybdopterin/thiamine biosynthesis adenylyltransferase [bacterium]
MYNYTAHIIRLSQGTTALDVLKEIREKPGIQIFDTIENQLKELVKCRNPKVKFKENPEIYQHLIEDYLLERPKDSIGNWVYYPWNNTLIRLLEEGEFVEIRTNRNKYKITDAEQTRLQQKIVGVIGLSVGQTVALTMAMERVFGEIRLADFDEIDLSNLNRVRTNLANIGINKAVLVAREIAEIDPYLKVTVFEDGITEDNLHSFFTENGQLDALVEECDGLDIKIIARQKAKALGIPVVMETNDRAMLDIERFDLEPDRPILHGLVQGLDVAKLKTLKTNEDKVPYMLDMIGIDDTSALLRASMLEIEQSVNTWPQLASSVTFGGGIVADAIRRILLGEDIKSGRFYFDIEEKLTQVSDSLKPYTYPSSDQLALEAMRQVASKYPKSNGITLTKPQIEELVELAQTAPSGGNMQPWKWYANQNQIFAFVDASQAKSFLDYNFLGGMVGFGAAIENIIIGATKIGLKGRYDFVFDDRNPLVAVIDFEKSLDLKSSDIELSIQIKHRGTNRMLGGLTPIQDNDFASIKETSEQVEGANLTWIKDKKEELGEVLCSVERIRLLTDRGHTDFIDEIRWTVEEAESTKDGIDLRTIDLTETEKAGLYVSKNYSVVRQLRDWGLGYGFESMMRKAIENTDRIGFISMPKGTRRDYFEGGRALQRAWLKATELNLGFHPISPSTFIFNRFVHDNDDEQLYPFKSELKEIRHKFKEILDLDDEKGEIFLFRLFKGKKIQTRSLRRDLKTHLFFEES